MGIKTGYTANEGVLSDGNLTLMIVPAAEVTDPTKPSAALLNGTTAYDLTYDASTGGWNHTPGNEEIETGRLTLPQALKREGKQTDTVELQYAYSLDFEDPDNEIDKLLVVGAKYYIFARWAVEHDEEFAAEQLVDVFPVVCGRKRKDAPTAGAELTKTVTLNPFGKVLDDIALVA